MCTTLTVLSSFPPACGGPSRDRTARAAFVRAGPLLDGAVSGCFPSDEDAARAELVTVGAMGGGVLGPEHARRLSTASDMTALAECACHHLLGGCSVTARREHIRPGTLGNIGERDRNGPDTTKPQVRFL